MQSGGRKQGSGWRMSGVATVFPSPLKRLGPFCVACLRLPKGRSCACCSSACVRAYEPTIKPVLTPLTVHHLLFLFRIQFRHSSGTQRDLFYEEMTQSLCACQWCWNMSVERVNTTSISVCVLASSARLRVSDGARRTCFDRWHASVSTVERQSEGILHTMTPPCRKVRVKHGPHAVGLLG
jgi:hypothetical protein